MKPTLAPGPTLTRRITIDKDRTIGFMGEELRVYATPKLVSDVEYASRDLLLQHLDEGEDSVGTRVEIDHLAASPLGSWVEITVTIAKLAGRLVTLDVAARDALEQVARGAHVRFVVDIAKTRERLKAKAAMLKG